MIKPLVVRMGKRAQWAETPDCFTLTAQGSGDVCRALRGHPIDTKRVYLVGEHIWGLLAQEPRLFAAAVAVGDAPQPWTLRGQKRIPVWAIGAELAVRCLRESGNTHVREGEAAREEIRAWLFAQTLENQLEAEWLQPGLWRILDGMGDTAYLVEGREKALLIDTAMARPALRPFVERLTRLPVELAVTHAHGDHMLHADEFDVVYLHPAELEILPVFRERMMPDREFSPELFTPMRGGDTIELGGVSIEVIELPGHTPGSVVLADRSHRCLFTGDAIGSGIGVLMSIMGALPLGVYRESLLRFRERIRGMEDFTFCGGHFAQQDGDAGEERVYNPLRPQVADDMAALCERLIAGDGSVALEPVDSWTEEQAYRARFGCAAMWVCKSQFR